MISRWALPGERSALQALWQRVFGDEEAWTARFFRTYPPERHTRVIGADGAVASMASWFPVTLSTAQTQYHGAYLYAVATAPEHRRAGLAGALLRELEADLAAQGLAFACLCPASDRLYDYYGAQGYAAAFFCDHFLCAPAGEGLALERVDAQTYRAARLARLRPPCCDWDAAALAWLEAGGTRFYRFPGGCAAVSRLPDGTLRMEELLSENAHVAAAGLCAALDAPRAEVFTPGTELPHGMMKWFTFGQKIPPAHLGFAFD